MSLEDWRPGNHEKEVRVVADRLILRPDDTERILDSLELAFRFGAGRLEVWIPPDGHYAFSNELECADCGIQYNAPLPNLFSFNSPIGACDTCRGFGRTIGIDLDLIIPDPSRSLENGAVKPFGGREEGRMEFEDLMAFCRRQKILPTYPSGSCKMFIKKRSSKEPLAIAALKDFSAGLKPEPTKCRCGYTYPVIAAMTSAAIATAAGLKAKRCSIAWEAATLPIFIP